MLLSIPRKKTILPSSPFEQNNSWQGKSQSQLISPIDAQGFERFRRKISKKLNITEVMIKKPRVRTLQTNGRDDETTK